MTLDFSPSIVPYLDILPLVDSGNYLDALGDYLFTHASQYPQIISDFATPNSPCYLHLLEAFFAKASEGVNPTMSPQQYKAYFHNNVVKPAQKFMLLGENMMAKGLGARISGGQTSTFNTAKPVPPPHPKTAEPPRKVVPPPRRPQTTSFGGGGTAPRSSAVSSENKIYMSQRPPGVSGDLNKVKAVLIEALNFSVDLVEPIRHIRQIKKEGVQACILVGPVENPGWADQMLEAKPQSLIKHSTIHMARANPRPVQQSPDRSHQVEAVTAMLNRISVGDEIPPPPPQSPHSSLDSPFSGSVQSGGGGNRKRGFGKQEGQQKLSFEGAEVVDMDLGSPALVRKSKQPNVGQTPATVRAGKQSGQGGEAATNDSDNSNTDTEGGDGGGISSVEANGEVGQVHLDDATPQIHPIDQKDGEEAADDAMTN
jgi:hypothetical protein